MGSSPAQPLCTHQGSLLQRQPAPAARAGFISALDPPAPHPDDDGEEGEGDGRPSRVRALREAPRQRRPLPLVGQEAEGHKPQEGQETCREHGIWNAGSSQNSGAVRQSSALNPGFDPTPWERLPNWGG